MTDQPFHAITSPPRDYWPTHGWRTADPAEQGMDSDLLARAVDHLTADYPHFDSLIIARHGLIVAEQYSGKSGRDVLHNLKSVTKSVLSILIGIALDTGDITSLDDTLGQIFADQFTSGSDPQKRAITIRHLLALRSGLDWKEYGPSTVQMTASPNWVNFVLKQPVIHEPGKFHNYSTGDTQLLSAVLQRLTGMSALDFADLYLFDPLGITRRVWPADPQGTTIGGSELALAARDMAKIGYLMLNQGMWEGQSIVSADWVKLSTMRHSLVIPAAAKDCPEVGYGYLWWLRPQGDYASFLAVGFGGQFITVIPALDLVVVLTGDLKTAPETFGDNRMLCFFDLVEDYVVTAGKE
jgi:CubicO group peptidase (beta-lactamase class C family)